MLDLPYTALIWFALALVLLTRENRTVAWIAGLSCSGAVMLAYQALFFVPLVFWAARSKDRRRHFIWILPLVSVALYGAINSLHFGRFIGWDLLAFWYQQPVSAGGFWGKVVHSFLALLGAVVFPAVWLVLLKRRRAKEDASLSAQIQNSGISSVTACIGMIVINVLVIVFIYQVGTVRYWLPATPAICILLVREIERRFRPKWQIYACAAVVVATALLSFLLANADYEWAEFYRETPDHVRRSWDGAYRIWFTGEWGFRWYLTRHGAQVLGRADNRAEPGDLLVRPRIASPYRTLYDVEPGALELEGILEYKPSSTIRVLDFDSRAGFYSSGWGFLPYSFNFSGKPLEIIAVYQIKKVSPPPSRKPTYWDWNRIP